MHIKNIKSNVVLIGGGYWGTNIAKNLVRLKRNIILFDTNIENAKTLKKRFPNKIVVHKSYKELLKNEKLKFFIFATPPSKNFKLIKLACSYKKKIFLEKPGFKSLTEFNLIKKKFPKNSQNIMFGYIYMFNNYIKYIKKFIKKKSNGKILYIKFQRQNLGPIRNDVNVSYDLSSHDISILFYLFNSKIRLLNSNSYNILKKNISDISNLSFKIKNFYTDINNSWLNPDKVRRLIIITSKKMLLFDEMKTIKKIKIFNKYAKYPKLSNLKNKFFFKGAEIFEGNNFEPKIKENDPLYDEINYFLNNKNIKMDKFNIGYKVLKILQKLKN